MGKVKELATQTLLSREQSLRVMMQDAVIRRAFGVKDDEHEKPFQDYDRQRVMTDDEIRNEFERYKGFYNWAIETNDIDKQTEFRNRINYFIEAVKFFSEDLANEFENNTFNTKNDTASDSDDHVIVFYYCKCDSCGRRFHINETKSFEGIVNGEEFMGQVCIPCYEELKTGTYENY